MTEHHHASTHEPTTKPSEPRDPALTPTADEKALLGVLLAIDAKIRAAATHIGQKPGDGLMAWMQRTIGRDTGINIS